MCDIETKLDLILKGIHTMSANQNQLQTDLDNLQAAVASLVTLIGQAVTLLNTIPGLIANGATAAQLQEITTMQTNLANAAASLQSAVTTDTPPAPPTT